MNINKKDYDSYILNLDLKNSEEVILNGSVENAQSLFLRLIDGATKTINIISAELKDYNTINIKNAMENAISKGVEVKILLDGKDINADNNFLKYCNCTKGSIVKRSLKPLPYHILTRDGKAYRYCQNTNGHNAIACFNGTKIAEQSDSKIFSDQNYKNYKNY